jgi:uncharacterized protein (TIGR02453 family)
MLSNEVFQFLKQLNNNNNRDWFKKHKVEHDNARKKVIEFSTQLFNTLENTNNLDEFKVFRIYRDVRFSKNKTPYKTHFGIGFHRSKPKHRGGYYLHLEPGNSFLASGFWQPNKDDLLRIRKEIELDHETFSRVATLPKLIKSWNSLAGEQLKTAPKGFDKNHPGIKLLRFKQFIYSQKISDSQLQNKDFNVIIKNEFGIILPFLDFMGDILTSDLNGESLI